MTKEKLDYTNGNSGIILPDISRETISTPSALITKKTAVNTPTFKYKLSYLEAYEEEEAKKLIEEHLGFEPPRAAGWIMTVKVYVRPEDVHQLKNDDGSPVVGPDGKPMFIALPEHVRADDKWSSQVALVISQGPLCYKGERFKESGPWCRVGDWVRIPRNEGMPFVYKGIPMKDILDDSVKGIIEDPTYVTM